MLALHILLQLENDFKTSYVEVYPTGRSGCWIRFRISKHLMLKFIISGSRRRRGVVIISKHLMLKFILLMPWRYIRQHSISKHLMLKFIDLDFRSDQFDFDFKTSYVEVYQYTECSTVGIRIFQNILCWSLSVIEQNAA